MLNTNRPYNNVYGTLICDSSLSKPYKILRYSLGLTETEVYVYKSQFDSAEYLKVRTDIYYLEADKTDNNSEYLLNGEVAGEIGEVITRLQAIANILNQNDYHCNFEIYDDNLEFLDGYPESK